MIGAFPPPVNGLSMAFETLAEADEMREQFHIVKVDFAVKKQFIGVREILYKIYFNLRLLFRLKKQVKNSHFDIFYLNLSTSIRGSNRDIMLVKMMKRYSPDSKLVLHHHGGSFQSFYEGCSTWRKKKVRACLNRADIIIVLTKKLSCMFWGLIDDAKIQVVSNGIKGEEQLDKELLNKKLSAIHEKDCLNIVYLSTLIESKGFMEVLKSAELLKKGKRACKIHYIFAGAFRKKDMQDKFWKYIEEHKLKEMVEYRGVVRGEDKKKLLYQGDIFVLPTMLHEGQPISILETMAAGMPIVTTDQGGITDVVKDGINGKILKEVSSVCIADAITLLIDNKMLIERMARNNVNEVEQRYLEKYYIKNMIDIFQKVLDSGEME